MSEIAREAGMATGTLYIYFKNKEELINSLFADCRQSSIENYFKNYDASAPFKSGFMLVWMNILQYRVKHFTEVVFMDQCYHSPFLNDCTMKLTKQIINPLFVLIERGKEENVFKEVDTFSLMVFMFGTNFDQKCDQRYVYHVLGWDETIIDQQKQVIEYENYEKNNYSILLFADRD